MNITSRNHQAFELVPLSPEHGSLLGEFFEDLSPETRSRFGPHPLTKSYSQDVLCQQIGADNCKRFLIQSPEKVVGYFIVDFRHQEHEYSRYGKYGIDLDFSLDPVFAPCIADAYQSQGIASQAMNHLRGILKELGVRSLILLGGTQETNTSARQFYSKVGFKERGQFFTEYNGLNNIDMSLTL